MHFSIDNIKAKLEEALEILTRQRGIELATIIRPILYTNLDRGRIQGFIEGKDDLIINYVYRVADYYEILSPTIRELQVERSSKAWEALFENMLKWAYNFLYRYSFNESLISRSNAAECATDAAIIIMNAYFPYDTELEPWARVILHHVCQKFIGKNKEPFKREESLDGLDEQLDKLTDPAFLDKEHQQNLRSILLEAIKELPESRKEVIELVYFQEIPLVEIARKMGKSVGAIYNLHFNALHELRKILDRNRDNLNG